MRVLISHMNDSLPLPILTYVPTYRALVSAGRRRVCRRKRGEVHGVVAARCEKRARGGAVC
eukprot:8515969-Pyramimonas_sp.AAC.1